MNNLEQTQPASQPTMKLPPSTIYETAAGLIFQDCRLLLPLFLLCALPSVVLHFTSSTLHGDQLVFLGVLERIVELSALFIIGRRTLATLSAGPLQRRWSAYRSLLVIGLIPWLLLMLPVQWLATGGEQILNGALVLALAILVIALCYLYFFYFFPAIAGVASPRQTLNLARKFTVKDPWSPAKACLAPLAAMLILQQVLRVPYPDWRELGLQTCADAGGSIFWILSSYLGMAFCVHLIDERDWRELNLAPYREARLATLQVQGANWLTKFLRPANGAILLALSALLWLANESTLSQLPPAAQVTLETVSLNKNVVSLDLLLSDSKYDFNGFLPLNFRIAGETGNSVTTPPLPVSATLKQSGANVLLSFPRTSNKQEVTVKFVADRPAAELRQLQDLYLWYRGVKLTKINLAAVPDQAAEK